VTTGPPRPAWRSGAPPPSAEYAAALDVGLDPYQLVEEMRAAGCTLRERQVVLLWLARRSVAQTARRVGLERGKVMTMLRSALEKLQLWRQRRARRRAFAALPEVYAAERNRFGYAPEQHCLPGEEECRHTGLCTRRWYLYLEETL
jgi:DNA-binding CsgD family transcriptional regulator